MPGRFWTTGGCVFASTPLQVPAGRQDLLVRWTRRRVCLSIPGRSCFGGGLALEDNGGSGPVRRTGPTIESLARFAFYGATRRKDATTFTPPALQGTRSSSAGVTLTARRDSRKNPMVSSDL